MCDFALNTTAVVIAACGGFVVGSGLMIGALWLFTAVLDRMDRRHSNV